MSKPVESIIDGVNFYITKFPALEAIRVQTVITKKLSAFFGGIAGTLLDAATKTKTTKSLTLTDLNIDTEQAGNFLINGLNSLDEDDLVYLFKRTFKNTVVKYTNKGKTKAYEFSEGQFETTFNVVFEQNIITAYKLFFEIVKVNYQSFLALLGRVVARAGGEMTETDT